MKKDDLLKKWADSLGTDNPAADENMRNLFLLEKDPSFVDRTIKRWESRQANDEHSAPGILIRLFPFIAAASVIILLIGFGSIYYTEGDIDTSAIIGMEEITDEEAYVLLNE